MKVFSCHHCHALAFFENHQCLTCGHELGFLPDAGLLSALEPAGEGLYRPLAPGLGQCVYRKCRHYAQDKLCNWMVMADDPHELCRSCRLTRTIPDQQVDGNRERWRLLEAAKRRLVYGLDALALPIAGKEADPARGLAFDFLASTGTEPAHIGHDSGVITINIAEADDPYREQQRVRLGERYRTLLGHFRHESGHYYFTVLIEGSPQLAACRELFGDERADYDAAVARHYASGPPPKWEGSFVSAYATMHPAEDWAETWAHYLHVVDAVEIASNFSIAVKPRPADPQARGPETKVRPLAHPSFDELIAAWFPLTFALNSLNRGMGMPDWYPFVVSPKVLDKLRFIHGIVEANHAAAAPAAPAAAMGAVT